MQRQLRKIREEQHSGTPAVPEPKPGPTLDADGFSLSTGFNMYGVGRQGNHFFDVGAAAAGAKGLVYYAPAALLSSGGGDVGHIAAMRDVAAPNSRKWWSPDNFQQDVNFIESSPVFIVLRKDNARR